MNSSHLRRVADHSPLVIQGGAAVLPDRVVEDAFVVCRDGLIADIGVGRPKMSKGVEFVDASAAFVVPGFVDLHVHGGHGSDFMDGTPEAVRRVNRAHARHGTTTIFPTTTTGTRERIEAMLDACLAVRDGWSPDDGARIGGVHYYGPFFAEGKVGCHAKEDRRDPTAAEYDAAFRRGIVKIATCAAELPGASAFFKAATKAGCLVTCGHSEASWTEMERAYAAGMRHVDHFWCAMSSVPSLRKRFGVPMQGSMAEFVLMHREMSTEVIADGRHLAPELLKFALAMKGPDRLCLVTDANRALDMPPGDYRFGHEADGPLFRSDGKVGWMSDGALASSVVGLDVMVRRMANATGAPLEQVVRLASLTPAERVGLADEIGSIGVGKRADLLILDASLHLKRVFIGGVPFSIRKPRRVDAAPPRL